MFDTLCALIPRDPDMPARYRALTQMQRVLDGTIYDVLTVDFHDEKSPSGEYVPIRQRKPCVRYALSAIVVADTVAMLFGEGRFPEIDCEDVPTREALADLVKDSRMVDVMSDAALRGSVGSIAVRMRILVGRLYLDTIDTATLTPVWKADEPDVLERVTQAYKVKGHELMASCGYTGLDKGATYWWRVVWDDQAETCYVPQPIADASAGNPPVPDPSRTAVHGLGFVPLVWIRNLPGGSGPDGGCTFKAAIHTQIEIDYQLSQAGRGLKYSSDPQLVIKEPAAEGELVKAAGNALVVSENGDAKLLEIGGSAAAAVIEYVRALREFALESVHGNRSSADKLATAQSGRAMELMHQPLINLTDHLRSSYGERGLLDLVRMIVKARAKYEFTAAAAGPCRRCPSTPG